PGQSDAVALSSLAVPAFQVQHPGKVLPGFREGRPEANRLLEFLERLFQLIAIHEGCTQIEVCYRRERLETHGLPEHGHRLVDFTPLRIDGPQAVVEVRVPGVEPDRFLEGRRAAQKVALFGQQDSQVEMNAGRPRTASDLLAELGNRSPGSLPADEHAPQERVSLGVFGARAK